MYMLLLMLLANFRHNLISRFDVIDVLVAKLWSRSEQDMTFPYILDSTSSESPSRVFPNVLIFWQYDVIWHHHDVILIAKRHYKRRLQFLRSTMIEVYRGTHNMGLNSILFYSILFYSTLFYPILLNSSTLSLWGFICIVDELFGYSSVRGQRSIGYSIL